MTNKFPILHVACASIWTLSTIINLIASNLLIAGLNFITALIWFILSYKSVKDWKKEKDEINEQKKLSLKIIKEEQDKKTEELIKQQAFDFWKEKNGD